MDPISQGITVADYLRGLVPPEGALAIAVISLMLNAVQGYLLWACGRARLGDKDDFAEHLQKQVERFEDKNNLLAEFVRMGQLFQEGNDHPARRPRRPS